MSHEEAIIDQYMGMLDTLADIIREIRTRTEAGESRGVVDDVLEKFGVKIEYDVSGDAS